MIQRAVVAAAVSFVVVASSHGISAPKPDDNEVSKRELKQFRARLTDAATKHLDLLLDDQGHVKPLSSKAADSQTALSYYLMFEMTGDERYRKAAVELADRIVAGMRETRFGVLYIKEKTSPSGEVFRGGGPPSFGWYTGYVGYIYHKEGGHDDDLKYIATVVDDFPWNEEGWWSADINVDTGASKQPLTKPSPINKNAAMAMAAAMLGNYVAKLDLELSKRLKQKADRCVYDQILPVQEKDGYWHYNLNGNDPGSNDILGYFMVTVHALLVMEEFADGYDDNKFQAAMKKAIGYSVDVIAAMTDPNDGQALCKYATRSTPDHFTVSDDPRRGMELAQILIHGGQLAEGIKIADAWLTKFPYGNHSAEGCHAIHPTVLMLHATK
jgi:hypothetical protein